MTTSDAIVVDRPQGQPGYADLSRSVRAAGLLDRRRYHYLGRIVLNFLAFAVGGVAFVWLGDSWWQLFVAAFLALVFTQFAFIGHDAGHKQIFRSRRANDVTGFVHGGLVGLSYGWWVGQHTQHHAHPNHETKDPDVDIPVLAFTIEQGHAKRGVVRWVAKYQAFLFFPLLLLEGLSLHWSSIRSAWGGGVRKPRLEKVLLVLHFAAYLTAVFLVLSPLTGIVFVLVHQCLWGVYMGCSFAPNHKGMPTLPDGHTLDFLRRQVLTSRNVRGGPWVDFALGGLNYQIEHHLFPNMPRPNLRHAQVIVQDFCLRHGIEYAQCGLLRSYRYVLEHLHAMGAPLRVSR
ncbi:fatty acid desaturase family protein [Amycolatopsis cihanbeyliensis]|uniref:Fatty acid desaturase n=1 Tax=Amycolatopsis cihanbeyliensis TaxID=1128664 RepID=A0A542DIA7_AMYCI|nr:acyl-CoA desaturase [Amycolatopsis cihanbeyliensis]TQJ02813.1 fatty acid desaturase [Amycolatopsis cihanbeyliensis]